MSDLPSWAKPGMKVVCVNDSWEGGASPLVYGATYTVTRAYISTYSSDIGPFAGSCHPCLGVREVYNQSYPGGGFAIERFRPLVTEQDDLETHFYQYLKTDHRATQKTEERA